MKLFSPRLKAQFIKELLSFLRDPRTRLMLIVPPIVQLMIFSFAITLEVKNASIAIYDKDHGYWAQEFVQQLRMASFVGRISFVQNTHELQQKIDKREVLLTIEIPESFSRQVAAGKEATIQLIVDGRRANSGQIAAGYVQSIAMKLSGQIAPEVKYDQMLAVRHWFNPNLIYQWFVVPGFVGVISMLMALIVTGLSIARERELGTFNQLLVSPCTPGEIIVAKTLPAVLIGSTVGMVMVGMALLIFRLPHHGSILLLYFLMILFILSVVGIGLMISSVSATQQQAILGTFAVLVPMILMSGFATPVENMPALLQMIAEAIPLKHFQIIVQGTFLRDMSAIEVWSHAWPLAAIACCTLTLATVMIKRRLQ